MNIKSNVIRISILLSMLLLVVMFFSTLNKTQAETTDGVFSGYAWSSNIGWVSMSCENAGTCEQGNYGVTLNDNGNLTGYAWSSNIGWLQFGGLSGFPTGDGTQAVNARLNGNQLEGWVRFLSHGDGWDGWVSLSGTSYGIIKTDDSKFLGYAWGSDVVGWMKMIPPTAVCEQSETGTLPNSATIPPSTGNGSDLCSRGVVSSSGVVQSSNIGWSWVCEMDNTLSSEKTTCSASCPIGQEVSGDECIDDEQCDPDIVGDCDDIDGDIDIEFRANPTLINKGGDCNLEWSINVDQLQLGLIECEITAPNSYSKKINPAVESSVTFTNVMARTRYTITCSPIMGINGPTFSETAVCAINPGVIEF